MDANEKMRVAALEILDFNFLAPKIQTSQTIEVIANQRGVNYWELRNFYWELRQFSREQSRKNKEIKIAAIK